MRKFKYSIGETTYLGELEIKDIGNFSIEAIDTDKYFIYYMCVFTKWGKTTIFKYGPLAVDSDKLPDSVYCSMVKKEFSDSWISKEVKKFLLGQKGVNITQVNVLDYEECLNKCKNLAYEMKFMIQLLGTGDSEEDEEWTDD